MGDSTIDMFHARLADVRGEIQTLQAKIERQQAKLLDLQQNEKTIVDALDLLGLEVPGEDQRAITDASARRRKGKLRAIDVAIQVVEPGEICSIDDIITRCEDTGLKFESVNPQNAIATAMRRSPQFEFLGSGKFKRRSAKEVDSRSQAAENGIRDFTLRLSTKNNG